MPENKDLKRLVRSRMQKTSESYTTARTHLLNKAGRARPAPPAPPPVDHAALAGMSDDAVQKKTGRTWAQWVLALDASGAMDMTHTAIAAMLHKQFEVPQWWSQMVTVGYERIRGRRAKNQLPTGFAVNKSKTFAVPAARLRAAFSRRVRTEWLGDEPRKERKSTPRVVRWRNDDGSWVDVNVLAKGPTKSTATVQQTRLRSSADVERARATWALHFAALAAWLAQSRPSRTSRRTPSIGQ